MDASRFFLTRRSAEYKRKPVHMATHSVRVYQQLDDLVCRSLEDATRPEAGCDDALAANRTPIHKSRPRQIGYASRSTFKSFKKAHAQRRRHGEALIGGAVALLDVCVTANAIAAAPAALGCAGGAWWQRVAWLS